MDEQKNELNALNPKMKRIESQSNLMKRIRNETQES